MNAANSTVSLEEHQEKLRRVVDSWRGRTLGLLSDLQPDPYGASSIADVCSSNSDPVHVTVRPLEHSDLLTLTESDNVAISKFIRVLSYDCIEISKLHRHASKNMYKQLLLFGHRSSSQEILLEGEPQKAFGYSLSLFMELSEITLRMSAVLGNLLQQLDSIYSSQDKSSRPYKSFKNATLPSAFSSFGDGLAMLLILDEILAQNGQIKSYLSFFARMLKKVQLAPLEFGISIEDLDCLEQVVNQLEKLFSVGFFQWFFQEDSAWHDTLQKIRCNRKFLEASASCVHDGLLDIRSRLDTWKEFPYDRRKILHCLALFLFNSFVSAETPEKKLGKVILEMLQVVPVIYVEGGVRFMLLDLLKGRLLQSLSSWPTLMEACRDSDTVKSNYLVHLNEMHSRDWRIIRNALAGWVSSFHSTIYPMTEPSMVEANFRIHLKQIIQGILLASRIQIMAISILELHTLLEVPIKREKLKSLCHMVVLLKVVENTFHKKGLDIVQSLPHIINLIKADIEHLLLPAKAQLHSEVAKGTQTSKMGFLRSLTRGVKDMDTRLMDSLSSVLILLQMLEGGGSNERQIILSVALDVVQSIGHLEINSSRIKKMTSKLGLVADFQSILGEVTNCSFLYWRKEMIGTWFSMVYKDVNNVSSLQYLLDAFCDGLWLLKLGSVGRVALQSHEDEIETALKNEIIIPLCRDIETDLRLHLHSTLLKGSVHINPTKTGVRDLYWYLQMKPLRLLFKCINIKSHVESYLNSAFYNHTAMSSSNWKTYSEMRHLAEQKYELVLDDIHLPERPADHGIDVTEILSNLHKFVEGYMYNITTQVFIEKVSNTHLRKTLRAVGVEQIASSIATHGLGLMAPAINSVSEFLIKKNTAFAELLENNFIRSQLMKEYKFWKSDKGMVNKYTFARAEELKRAIGKNIGGDNEFSFLDQVRCVITEMGNALGFLRILLTGSSRHACTLSRFILHPRSIASFSENSSELGFTNGVLTAGRIMDMAIENTYHSLEHTSNFSFFITTFIKELQSSEHIHLRDFFLMIPALTIYLADCKILSKDKIPRRGNDAGSQSIADDGFMFGIAYILKVTGQGRSFDGLQWFACVAKHYEEAILALEESSCLDQHKGSSLAGFKLWSQPAPPISNEAQKSIDRLKRYQKEMELIQCGLDVGRTILY